MVQGPGPSCKVEAEGIGILRDGFVFFLDDPNPGLDQGQPQREVRKLAQEGSDLIKAGQFGSTTVKGTDLQVTG